MSTTIFSKITIFLSSQLIFFLSSYLQIEFPEGLEEKGVVIGYDGRHHSRSFAEITAAVFLSEGVRVRLFSVLVPTPFVPYAVLSLGAAAGVMVTASHNPKQDNGYKVYWADGCQIVEPRDRGIASQIAANLCPWPGVGPSLSTLRGDGPRSPLLQDPSAEVQESYMRRISSELCRSKAANASAAGPRIAFTPMHGVGGRWMALAFEAFGLQPFVPVPEQMEPDAEFPTVAFPNPEEGKGALMLAMKAAEAAGAPLILANDPDADRLAVAERDGEGGWRIFTGNEVGALLAGHAWAQFREVHPEEPAESCFMVNSTVSSKFIQAMAAQEGFQYVETLTGFKWIGSKALALHAEGKRFLLGFEEAIGFLVGTMGWDKDGIRTGAVLAEMAVQLYASGSTLQQKLEELYQKYGYFVSQNSYFFNHDPAVMYRIFDRLRSLGPDGYPSACGAFAIAGVRDLATGLDSTREDGRAVLPVSSSSPMTTFYFANGAVITLRGSGTEPKLKYYAEMHGPVRQPVVEELSRLVASFVEDFIQPQPNNLKPPAH